MSFKKKGSDGKGLWLADGGNRQGFGEEGIRVGITFIR